ncbi:MAG: hypothetical protein J7507_00420 [Pseudoxanthomonas sp.]|nr:hypothetical protein [Pseudoxanthomonas sp.]
MTPVELGFGLTSVAFSTGSQIAIRAAARGTRRRTRLCLLGGAVAGQLLSIMLVMLLLRTVALTLLVAFAGLAYFTVPFASRLLLKEQLPPRFWFGATLVFAGISCIALFD